MPATRAQVTLLFDWLAFALFGGQRMSFTANASQSNASVTSFTTNASQSNESVTGEEIDFYHHGIFFPVEIFF